MKVLSAIVAAAVMLLFCLRWFPAVPAAAWNIPAGYGSTMLTPQQTLALYGTALNAVYFDGVNNENITFQYYNCTSNLYDQYCQDENITPVPGVKLQYQSADGNMSSMGSNYGNMDPNNFVNHDFLIYRCQHAGLNGQLWSPWTFQVYLQNSIDISGIAAFYSSVFWSNLATFGFYPNSYNIDITIPDTIYSSFYNPDVNQSQLNLSIDGSVLSTPFTNILNGNSGNIFVFGSTMQPTSGYPSLGTPQPLYNNWYWFNGIEYEYTVPDVTSGDSFTWSDTTLYCQNMDSYPQVVEYDLDYLSGAHYVYGDPYIYLLVQCPVIYGQFILPDNTGSVSDTGTGSGSETETGTGSGSGGGCSCDVDVNVTVDVDLSPVLTRQDDQIDQLNQIIVQLQDIYDFMVENGQINPDLTPVSSITTNTTVKNKIDQALQDATFPQNSDFDTQTLSGLSDIISSVRSIIPAPMLFVYSFGLIGGLVSFIIFRRK